VREDLIILIVDDDDMFRQYIKSILKSTFNLKADEVQSPKEAIEYLNNQIPDLMFLDLEMPFMDGFTFLRFLRTNELFSKIPVIVCSVIIEKDLIEKIARWKIKDFMIKTIPRKEITKKIQKVLNSL
jgi:CheY-like chemotaxis protein